VTRNRPAPDFLRRAETFGLDTPTPWALPALRLLFHAPRVYAPLVQAWERHHPGTVAALDRLVAAGFVAHQSEIVVDARTRQQTERSGRAVDRYRTAAPGRRLLIDARRDITVLTERFPRLTPANAVGVLELLAAFDIDAARARNGRSVAHATEECSLAPRTARWWVRHLHEAKLLRRLPQRTPDAQPTIPAHWRVTRPLCTQIRAVLRAYPDPWGALYPEFRLQRERFLQDIDLTRVNAGGGTDYDHDVVAQELLASLLTSPRAIPTGVFDIEPRIVLTAHDTTVPWRFASDGNGLVFYQPDALFIVREESNRRAVLEYERFQSRRDAWSHIERFLGYLESQTLPFESAILYFVVDTTARERGYVELIEAFADYVLDHPGRLPGNEVTLAVSSRPRLLASPDPLHENSWFRVRLTGSDTTSATAVGTARGCVLHTPEHSPFNLYFGNRS
jgi:hypothetical protein